MTTCRCTTRAAESIDKLAKMIADRRAKDERRAEAIAELDGKESVLKKIFKHKTEARLQMKEPEPLAITEAEWAVLKVEVEACSGVKASLPCSVYGVAITVNQPCTNYT